MPCLILYANRYGSLGRVVIEPVLFNTNDSRTLRGTGLHAIGRMIGETAVSRSGALRSWMKEALSPSRLISAFKIEETRSPVRNLRIGHVSLGVLDASSFLVTRELIRLISSLIFSFK